MQHLLEPKIHVESQHGLSKLQGPSSDSFRDIWLTRFHYHYITKGITLQKKSSFFKKKS